MERVEEGKGCDSRRMNYTKKSPFLGRILIYGQLFEAQGGGEVFSVLGFLVPFSGWPILNLCGSVFCVVAAFFL